MILHENSLYKDQAEKDAFVQDKEKCANSLVYNFFGFLSLYSISEKKTQMKRYLSNEKDTIALSKIGDENADVSLAVKLAVEGGMPERTAKYMLKLLTKINQRTLKADDIDEDAIRELVKYARLQSNFKPSPALVSIINDFMDGTTNLTWLGYHLFKTQKRFTDVNQEFVDYYKKGHYNTLYSDYQHGKLTSPNGIPQHLVKTVSNLTKIYTKGTSQNPVVATPQAQANVTVQQPTPVLTQTFVQPQPVVVPVATPQPVVQIPVAPTITPKVYKYKTLLDAMKSSVILPDPKDCDPKTFGQSLEEFDYTDSVVVSTIKKSLSTARSQSDFTSLISFFCETVLAFSTESRVAKKIIRLYMAGVYTTLLEADWLYGMPAVDFIDLADIRKPSVRDFIASNDLLSLKDQVFNFGAFCEGTVLENSTTFYPHIVKTRKKSSNAQEDLVAYLVLSGAEDSVKQYVDSYTVAAVDSGEYKTLLDLVLNHTSATKHIDSIEKMFGFFGITDAKATRDDTNYVWTISFDSTNYTTDITKIRKVLLEMKCILLDNNSGGVSSGNSNTSDFFKHADSGVTIAQGGSARQYSIVEDLLVMDKTTRFSDCNFRALKNKFETGIAAIEAKLGVTMKKDTQSILDIMIEWFNRGFRGGYVYALSPQIFSNESLSDVPEQFVAPLLEILNDYLRNCNPNVISTFLTNPNVTGAFYAKDLFESPSSENSKTMASMLLMNAVSNSKVYKSSSPSSAFEAACKIVALGDAGTVISMDSPMIGNVIKIITYHTTLSKENKKYQFLLQDNHDVKHLFDAIISYKNIFREKIAALEYGGLYILECDRIAKQFEDVYQEVKADYGLNKDTEVYSALLSDEALYYHDKDQEFFDEIARKVTNDFKSENARAILVVKILSDNAKDTRMTDEKYFDLFKTLANSSLVNHNQELKNTVIFEFLSNPIFKDRIASFGEKGFTTVAFNDLGKMMTRGDSLYQKTINGDAINNDTTSDIVKKAGDMHKNNPFVNSVFNNAFKVQRYTGEVNNKLIENPSLWPIINVIGSLLRKTAFNQLQESSASDIRNVICHSKTAYDESRHSHLEKLDLKSFGFTDAEYRLLYDSYTKFLISAYTNSTELPYKKNFFGVLILVRNFEKTFGYKPNYTKANIEKFKKNASEVVIYEQTGGTKRNYSMVQAKFTLDDMKDEKYPIRPEEGLNKGSFATSVARNQPAKGKETDVLAPSFKAEKDVDKVFQMAIDRDVLDGNDSQKLAKLRPLCVDEIVATKEMLEETTERLHSTRRHGVHGDALPVVQRMFNVDYNKTDMVYKPHTKEQIDAYVLERSIDRNDNKKYLKVAFHGTGSMAAAFILRFGFKDTGVIVMGAGNAGQMLGDGMYLATNIDKATLYAWDGGVLSNNYGERGYIFICEAALGERGVDFEYAAPGEYHDIKGREWCIANPTRQVWIKRAYKIEVVKRPNHKINTGNDWYYMPDTTVEY